MKKLVFISMVASPHQVRFIPHLRRYFDAEFYFYERLASRQKWWKVDLGEHGHILKCQIKWRAKYLSLSVFNVLIKERPDILMLGGFCVPSNYFAYLWAKWHKIPVVIMTERSRDRKGKLRKYGLVWRIIHWLYRKVDLVMVTATDIVPQFRDDFHFGEKVVAGQYPTDIDRYYEHKIRRPKNNFTILFANRMTELYNPLGAVDIFYEVHKRHPCTKMKMNSAGEMREEVENLIRERDLEDCVEFLDGIKNWDQLGEVYASCDIMILPAKFSNGNYTIAECAVSGMSLVLSDKILGLPIERVRQTGINAIVPLDNQKFVEKICWYIEHPEEIAKETAIYRKVFKADSFEETAKLYFDLLGNL